MLSVPHQNNWRSNAPHLRHHGSALRTFVAQDLSDIRPMYDSVSLGNGRRELYSTTIITYARVKNFIRLLHLIEVILLSTTMDNMQQLTRLTYTIISFAVVNMHFTTCCSKEDTFPI